MGTTGTLWPNLGRGDEGDVVQRPNLHFCSVYWTFDFGQYHFAHLSYPTKCGVVLNRGNPGISNNISWGLGGMRGTFFSHRDKMETSSLLRSQEPGNRKKKKKKVRNRTE